MAGLTIEGADQLRELAAKLRAADPVIRRELTKSLRPSVKAITSDIQGAVRGTPSKGRRGLGSRRRVAHTVARGRRLDNATAAQRALKKFNPGKGGKLADFQGLVQAEHEKHAAKLAKKAEQQSAGLRDAIASATAGSISTGSKTTGVSVTWRVRAAKMANSQRKLPKNYNSPKGWRHPVFGDRENWVTQHGTPYFDVTINRHRGDLESRVIDGMKHAAEAIVHPDTAV